MSDQNPRLDSLSRRSFVRAAAATPFALASVPGLFAGGSDQIKVGLVGCGGRGTGAATQALAADKGAVLTAIADVFADKLESSLKALKEHCGDKVQVGDDGKFVGLDGCQRLIDSGVDVVILATPTYFRPEHLEMAVAANKHIFTEKPMAVDAPGVRRVMKVVEEARRKKLSLVAGFCWRYSAGERAIYKEIADGRIGDVRAAYATYNSSVLRKFPRQKGWSDMEFVFRNWQHFNWLAGDHIVEQACHSVDKIAWAMGDRPPVRATAVGGRQARTGETSGDVYDHFSVTYEWADGARGFHMCRQINNCTNDNSDYVLGTKGTADINGWVPRHKITGENPWKHTGKRVNMYQQEHDELFASIRSGKPMNDGIRMAQSTMMSIMGRMAAYTGKTLTWDDALNSKLVLGPDKIRWGDYTPSPVPIPGKTKFQ